MGQQMRKAFSRDRRSHWDLTASGSAGRSAVHQHGQTDHEGSGALCLACPKGPWALLLDHLPSPAPSKERKDQHQRADDEEAQACGYRVVVGLRGRGEKHAAKGKPARALPVLSMEVGDSDHWRVILNE